MYISFINDCHSVLWFFLNKTTQKHCEVFECGTRPLFNHSRFCTVQKLAKFSMFFFESVPFVQRYHVDKTPCLVVAIYLQNWAGHFGISGISFGVKPCSKLVPNVFFYVHPHLGK